MISPDEFLLRGARLVAAALKIMDSSIQDVNHSFLASMLTWCQTGDCMQQRLLPAQGLVWSGKRYKLAQNRLAWRQLIATERTLVGPDPNQHAFDKRLPYSLQTLV